MVRLGNPRCATRRFPGASSMPQLTPYSGNGSGVLTLPDDWVRAPSTQTDDRPSDDSLACRSGHRARSRSLEARCATIRPSSRWRLDVDFRRQEKQGVDLSSGSVLFSAVELARPVDYTTDDLRARAEDERRWLGSEPQLSRLLLRKWRGIAQLGERVLERVWVWTPAVRPWHRITSCIR